MSAFIGGNLEAITESAARMDDSATKAMGTVDLTASAAGTLSSAVETAMTDLLKTFGQIGSDLSDDINRTHTTLVNADWQGSSRENAVIIKERLQTQVNEVIAAANQNLNDEKTAFNNRSQAIIESVNTEFKQVMTNVNTEYASLAKASRDTRANLEAADGTIRMG